MTLGGSGWVWPTFCTGSGCATTFSVRSDTSVGSGAPEVGDGDGAPVGVGVVEGAPPGRDPVPGAGEGPGEGDGEDSFTVLLELIMVNCVMAVSVSPTVPSDPGAGVVGGSGGGGGGGKFSDTRGL